MVRENIFDLGVLRVGEEETAKFELFRWSWKEMTKNKKKTEKLKV